MTKLTILQIVITPLLTIIVVLTAAAIASVLAILPKLIVPAQDYFKTFEIIIQSHPQKKK